MPHLLRKAHQFVRFKVQEYRVICFLLQQKTDEVHHKEGSFFNHLRGTYTLLKKWRVPKHVQCAGLLHSIYGTSIFRHQTISYQKRQSIVDMTSVETERLVYLFSIFDRSNGWGVKLKDLTLPRVSGKPKEIISKDELKYLAQIEYANLLDQKIQPSKYVIELSGIVI